MIATKAKNISFPTYNYKDEYSVRDITPIKMEYKQTEYHGETWHIQAYDHNKQDYRDFSLDNFVKGVIHFTLESVQANPTESKVEGVFNKLKQKGE